MSEAPKPIAAVTKVRIPLPKNAVLLSLMEAIDFASDNALRANDSSIPVKVDEDTTVAESIFSNSTQDDVSTADLLEEEELNKIKLGTLIMTGACGTYAVACKQGLIISQKKMGTAFDHTQGTPRQTTNPWDKEVDTYLQRNSSEDSKDGDKRIKGKKNSKVENNDSATLRTDMKLSYGDRVQVVSMVDGWAKLARGYGYIHCKHANDLVKGA